jgi:hypothetical protein
MECSCSWLRLKRRVSRLQSGDDEEKSLLDSKVEVRECFPYLAYSLTLKKEAVFVS